MRGLSGVNGGAKCVLEGGGAKATSCGGHGSVFRRPFGWGPVWPGVPLVVGVGRGCWARDL